MILFKKSIFYILLFCYVYNIAFVFLPLGLKSAMVVGGIGVGYVYCYRLYNNKAVRDIFILSFPILFWSLISTLLNMHLDLYFPRMMILSVVYSSGAFFLINYRERLCLENILNIVVLMIIANNLLAIGGLFSNELKELLANCQKYEREVGTVISMERATGLGNVFFGGGVKTALGLIFSCFLYKRKVYTLFRFLLILIVLLITGVFIARTSLLGLIGLILLFSPLRKNWYKLTYVFAFLLFLLFLLPYIENYSTDLLGANYTKFAFGIIESLSESGDMNDGSMNSMIEMYKTVPQEMSTWILGDGLMHTPDGSYYMHTDIGYFRIIFGMGLIGLILHLLYTFKLLRMIYRYSNRDSQIQNLVQVLFIFQLAILAKGEISFWNILYLMVFASVNRREVSKVV